jgi:hypothetical protein
VVSTRRPLPRRLSRRLRRRLQDSSVAGLVRGSHERAESPLLGPGRGRCRPPAMGAQWSEQERKRTRSYWLLSATLDALEQGDRCGASAHLRRALRLHPRSIVDGRAAAALVGLPLGRRAGRLVRGSGRALARRRRWQKARRPERSEANVG